MSFTGQKEDQGLFTVQRLPMASIRNCKLCNHSEIYRYTGGHRGAGMVGGNKARGRMIQHLKSVHPAEYADYLRGRPWN